MPVPALVLALAVTSAAEAVVKFSVVADAMPAKALSARSSTTPEANCT